MIDQDHLSQTRQRWPFFEAARCTQAYFQHVNRKTERLWFQGYGLPRGHINLVTRLRTGHFCVGVFFERLRWDISSMCRCGEEISSLNHYIRTCRLFSSGRMAFLEFLRRSTDRKLSLEQKLEHLIFYPNMEGIKALGDFLLGRGIII